MTNRFAPAAGIAAALIIAGSANAATLSGLITLSAGSPTSGANYIASGDVPYFDTRLGTLTQVSIFSYYDIDFNLSSYVVGNQSGFPTVQIFSDPATISSSDNTAFQSLPAAFQTIAKESNSPDYGANAYILPVPPGVELGQDLAGSQMLTVDPSLYGAFESSVGGDFNLTITKDVDVHSLWTPDRGGAGEDSLAGTIYTRVAYTYTPFAPAVTAVPEPASWALMILGLGATGASLRSRRQRALAG